MGINNRTKRQRIEAQGFVYLANDEVEDLNVWLRFAPALTFLWLAAGVLAASPKILLTLLIFTALGAILTGHPFDVLYNHGIRHLTGTAEIPPFSRQRRFAYLIGSFHILITAVLFYFQFLLAGYLFGLFSVATSAVYVLTGFCMPSHIYGHLFHRPEPEDPPLDSTEKKIESISPLWPK